MARSVLLVDDEQQVLDALARQLRNKYDVHTAAGGEAALALIEKHVRFDVIVSDMRMPVMDGGAFLAIAQEKCPSAVRMMLTGNADQETAVKAINRGAIFRFLNKPCETDALIEAIEACGTQHDLIVAERELLESTLSGAVRALVDILALAQPESFGRSQTVKTRAGLLAKRIGINETWSIELAALLSRIGAVVLPASLLHKVRADEPLSDFEKGLLAKVPSLGADVLEHIPRLEKIAEMVKTQESARAADHDGFGEKDDLVSQGAQIIRLLNDLADLENRGLDMKRAFFLMRCRHGRHDSNLLAAAEDMLVSGTSPQVYSITLADLRPGMRFMDDLLSDTGSLLVASASVASETLIERLLSHAPVCGIREPIVVDRPPRAKVA
jgi:response regulator RpfG family c-di-GMP phosphodiesterase